MRILLLCLTMALCGCVANQSTLNSADGLVIGMTKAQVVSQLDMQYYPNGNKVVNPFGTTEHIALYWDWLNGWHVSSTHSGMGGPIYLLFRDGTLWSISS